ncbi:hypothetical protein KV112_07025 [Mycolicibacter sp. MYC123]|uniref:Transposase n=1 Tax=[Mycobacterium] zoologicum TaxID=2872311 RepID=A0ABU5YHE7_9MYCO|nr:hypothetical protein [Mycolicibacter sp. MYC123]MEB3049489.1 hypothetical protein [Mycolicibacter sp. MYC123]
MSRSGFYKWRATQGRGPTPTQQRRTELDAKVAAFHKASDGVYGAPRILADLRDDGEMVSATLENEADPTLENEATVSLGYRFGQPQPW